MCNYKARGRGKADYVVGGWRFYFATMKVYCDGRTFIKLFIVDGKLHYGKGLFGDGALVHEEAQIAYSKWLDQQIYGESHD